MMDTSHWFGRLPLRMTPFPFQFINDSQHPDISPAHRNFRLADAITLSNGICGVLSIFFSIKYLTLSANLPTPPNQEAINALYLAHLCPILGFGFDALDGKVARWTGGGSLLGQELDSLADLVSIWEWSVISLAR